MEDWDCVDEGVDCGKVVCAFEDLLVSAHRDWEGMVRSEIRTSIRQSAQFIHAGFWVFCRHFVSLLLRFLLLYETLSSPTKSW
jgi:hypothetical protein